MSSVERRLGVNLIWNTLHTWGGIGVMLVATVIYARFLRPEQWGIYSTFTWLVANSSLLVILGWNLTINKFVAEAAGQQRLDRAANVFQLVILIELAIAAILSVVGMTFASSIAGVLGRPEVVSAMPLILLGMTSMVVYTTCNMVLIALQRYKQMSIVVLITALLSLASGLTWLSLGGSSQGLLAITASANLVNAVISLTLISRWLPIWSPIRLDRDLLGPLGMFCLSGTAIHVLTQIVYERSEVFFLSRTQPTEQVGYYILAIAMVNIAINGVPSIVIGPLLAMAADLQSRNDRVGLQQLYQSATRLLILVAPPVGIGGAIIAWPLINVMYGDAYMPVAVVAILMLPVAALIIVAKPATSLMWGLGKQSIMLKALVPGAVLNLTLDAIVIPVYGLYGAVLASGFSQVVTTTLTTYVCLKYLGYHFPWSRLCRATAAALLMVPFGLLPLLWLEGLPVIVAQVTTSVIAYPIGLLMFGMIDLETISLLNRVQTRLPRPLQWPVATVLTILGDRLYSSTTL